MINFTIFVLKLCQFFPHLKIKNWYWIFFQCSEAFPILLHEFRRVYRWILINLIRIEIIRDHFVEKAKFEQMTDEVLLIKFTFERSTIGPLKWRDGGFLVKQCIVFSTRSTLPKQNNPFSHYAVLSVEKETNHKKVVSLRRGN